MTGKLDTTAILEKMEELCTALLKQESYKELRLMIDQFSSDELAIQQYERFMDKQHFLQQKEQQELVLTQVETNDYQQEELALYDNSVIRKFLYAQREFSQLHSLISQYFTRTVEFDRLPKLSELKKDGCGCGGSCGGGEH
jgi:cell fate (sporulation/competence/biofilm development) regulator YlbF (YheA/YmcA/DUF963 family)